MSTSRCGWICPRSYFFTAVFLAAASFAVLWGWTPTAICGPILTTGRGTRLIRCSDLLRTRRGWRRLRLAEYAGRRRKADELACKPDSVIWAFVPFTCVGGVVTVQVRVLGCWLMKAVVSSTADGLRTVAGTRATHHHEVSFAGTGGDGAKVGCWVSRWPWVRAVPRPGRVDPGKWPRTAVGPARRGPALLRGPDCAQQPAACRCHIGGRGSGDPVRLPRRRPSHGRDLHSRGVPHLPVRVRDGIGLVGPLVIPGVTSCLVNH